MLHKYIEIAKQLFIELKEITSNMANKLCIYLYILYICVSNLITVQNVSFRTILQEKIFFSFR